MTSVLALVVLALSVLVPVGAGAVALEQHCPGANNANAPAIPNGFELLEEKVEATGTEYDSVISDAAYVCVKGGPYASGIVAPAGRTMKEILEDAGITVGNENVPGVSYYMTYRRQTVEVTVSIAKEWTGDLEGPLVGTNVRFDVTIGAVTRNVGIGELASFPGLLVGQEYTVTWTEVLNSLPPPWTNEAGERCAFSATGSETSGFLGPFTAGQQQVVSLAQAVRPPDHAIIATNNYVCIPPPPPPPPPLVPQSTSASVVVAKVWTVDGDVFAAPDDVDLAFDVTLGTTTRTMSATGTEVFSGLIAGMSYPVTVEEDVSELPDGEELFGVGCEFMGSDVVLSATSVTAPGSVTATVTNAYECPDVEEEVLAAVDVEALKTWFQNSNDGPVELEDVPTGAEPSYEVVVRGPDAKLISVEELDADDSLTLLGLEDGETYLLTWEETDPLAEFELDGATCTWSEDDSEYFGSETFVAGEVETVSFTGVNVYDCDEVLGTVVTRPTATTTLATTGGPVLWLTLLGLLGMGLGGGLLGRRRER